MRCGGTLQEGDAVFRGRAGHGLQVNGMSGNEHYLGIFSKRGVGRRTKAAHKASAIPASFPSFLLSPACQAATGAGRGKAAGCGATRPLGSTHESCTSPTAMGRPPIAEDVFVRSFVRFVLLRHYVSFLERRAWQVPGLKRMSSSLFLARFFGALHRSWRSDNCKAPEQQVTVDISPVQDASPEVCRA